MFDLKPPFRGLTPISGFGPLEGPYPQWKLPQPRQMLGSTAQAQFSVDRLGKGRLVLRARSPTPGQTASVKIDGKQVGTCSFPLAWVLVGCAFPVTIDQSSPVVDL